MADRSGGARRPSSPPARDIEKRRREFAVAIAKAEFGRFYWSAAQEQARREAGRKRSRPKG
jgi:hypothetical protein